MSPIIALDSFAKTNVMREDFNKTLEEAIRSNGLVRSDLKMLVFTIETVPKHNFTGTGKQAIEKARKWAEENLVGEHDYHKGEADEFRYIITGGKDGSIGKMLSSSSTTRSDNLGIHLAVLKHLPEVINVSFDVEIHPDYVKEQGNRKDNRKVGHDVLVHRLYGAIIIEETIYRVKTTIKEYKESAFNAYTYKVTEVELPISGSKASDALGSSTTISSANILQGIEKSYDPGKKLFD